jgi:hypothetical protein
MASDPLIVIIEQFSGHQIYSEIGWNSARTRRKVWRMASVMYRYWWLLQAHFLKARLCISQEPITYLCLANSCHRYEHSICERSDFTCISTILKWYQEPWAGKILNRTPYRPDIASSDLYSFIHSFIYLHVKNPLQVLRNRIQTTAHYINKIYENTIMNGGVAWQITWHGYKLVQIYSLLSGDYSRNRLQ